MASYLSSSLPSIQVILVLMVFAFTNPSFATGVYPDAADPDYYNDDVYYQLVAEYQDNLRLSAANKKNSGAAGEQDMERGLVPKEARQDENYDGKKNLIFTLIVELINSGIFTVPIDMVIKEITT